jgi:hypothetical protein
LLAAFQGEGDKFVISHFEDAAQALSVARAELRWFAVAAVEERNGAERLILLAVRVLHQVCERLNGSAVVFTR